VTRRVRWFDEALTDLVDHVTYIAERNPLAARKVAQRIRDAGNDLGTSATGRSGLVEGTFERVLSDIPYTLVYAIGTTSGDEVISILRVLHQAQQWPPSEATK